MPRDVVQISAPLDAGLLAVLGKLLDVLLKVFVFEIIHNLKQCRLRVLVLRLHKHLAEDVVKHINDNGIACEFVLCRIRQSACLHPVDVSVLYSHQPKALLGSKSPRSAKSQKSRVFDL